MSQGTPTREGRIERHLMRQRGAGVRTITADFGFSFALPVISAPPPVPIQLPVEPPAKRRKTSESISPRRCNKHTIADVKPRSPVEKQRARPAESQPVVDKIVEKSEPPPTQSTATKDARKKPTRTRRKLQLDDELEDRSQKKGKVAPQNASVEDTFIFGLKPTKRRPKRRQANAVLEEHPQERTSDQVPTAPPKRKRITKIKHETSDEPVTRAEAPSTTEEVAVPPKVAKSAKKASKTEAVSSTEIASQSDGANTGSTERPLENIIEATEAAKPQKIVKAKSAVTKISKVPLGPGESDVKRDIAAEPVAIADSSEYVKPKSSAKEASKRSTEQIEKDNEKDIVITAEPAVVTEPTKVAKGKPAAKKASKRSIEQVAPAVEEDVDSAAAPPAKRPRRQAAVDATQKVMMGYEEELVPTDKLRRAPDAVGKRGRRKKVAKGDNANPSPLSPPPSIPESITEKSPRGDRDDDIPPRATISKRGRKAATAAPVNDFPTAEVDEVSKNSQITGAQVSSEIAAEIHKEYSKPDKARNRPATLTKLQAAILDPGSANEAPLDNDHKSKEEILAAPRVRKSRKAINELNAFNQADEGDRPAATTPPKATEPVAPVVEQAKGLRKATTEKRPAKTRRALAESDVNIVRSSPLKATEKHGRREDPPAELKEDRNRATMRPSDDSQPSHRVQSTEQPMRSSGAARPGTTRSRKIQPVEQRIATPEVEPASPKPSISEKRHVIACEEDLDWLDEKAETKRSRPTSALHAIHKSRRKEVDHGAKDIDLDDLLESIAGFSGKLLTGKRGRAVAS